MQHRHGLSNCKRTLVALSVAAMFAAATGLACAEDDTITLGAAVSLTGKYSTNGKNTLDGYNLAVNRINELGGVRVGGKTYKLKITYYDDESTSARGAQLAERLINQDKIRFMLGPYSSGLTKAIAPVTEKYQVPMVEGNGADRDLFTQGYKWLFAVLSTSDYYLRDAVKLLAEQAKQQGKKPSDMKIAIAVENDNFSKDVRNGVEEDARKFGMKIIIDDKLPPELNDMSATLTKVKALRPDMLVVSGHEKGATLAVRQTADQDVHVPMLALTHCDSAQIAEKLGKAAERAVCASQWDDDLQYKDKWFGTAKDYAERFRKAYNYDAPYQAAESSASVLVYADALSRSGSLDPQKVREALAQTKLSTFYGPIQFDATGKNTVKPMVLYQVQNGEYKIVAPTQWAQAKFIYAAAGGREAQVANRK